MSRPRSVAVEQRGLVLNGLRIAAQVQGEGDPLLLINGMTRPLSSWEAFARQLPGRLIVSFDAPGVGNSPTPLLPLSIPDLAHLALSVLDAFDLEDAAVLGFSHGGAVAQQLAVDVPHRLSRLILVSTSCGLGATPGQPRALATDGGTSNSSDLWAQADPWGILWQAAAFASWSSIPFLGAITTPTLVVCGTHDRIAPPANSRLLARRIRDASLMLVPGGHDLQLPEPARLLAQHVEHFLGRAAGA
jgi:poly(3-hydroxyoctanoate) depolymerase